MLLIIEIILTVFAWKRGWKWWALVPVAIPFCIGLVIGAGIAVNGGSISDIGGWTVVFDILAIISLIILCSVKPKSAEILSETPKSTEASSDKN